MSNAVRRRIKRQEGHKCRRTPVGILWEQDLVAGNLLVYARHGRVYPVLTGNSCLHLMDGAKEWIEYAERWMPFWAANGML